MDRNAAQRAAAVGRSVETPAFQNTISPAAVLRSKSISRTRMPRGAATHVSTRRELIIKKNDHDEQLAAT